MGCQRGGFASLYFHNIQDLDMSWRAQGMRTWIMQRLSALYMLIYLVAFLVYISCLDAIGFKVWRGIFANPFINIATGFFFFSILYHAWVGIRDIMIDYVHWAPARFMLWVVVTAGLIALGFWVVMILTSVVSL